MEYFCIGGDTETCDGDANCFQLSLDGKTAHVFFTGKDSVEENFLDVLDSLPKTRDRTYVIWFHNLAFDTAVLFPNRHNLFRDDEVEFDSCGWEISGVYSHVCFFTLTKGHKRVMLLGTDSYFKTSLDSLAKDFCPDMPKLKPVEGIGQRFFTAEDKEFVDYAERDAVVVQIVGTRIIEMHERYQIPVSVSAPHMASRVFRRAFLKETIPLPPMAMMYSALHSYHGGKNNFPVERGLYRDVKCIDIKSAYPYAMSQFPSFSNPDLYHRIKMRPGFDSVPSFGIYKIDGTAHITPWPVIFSASFKPLYGDFSGVWITGFELNQALQSKLVDITECEGWYYDADSDKKESPFKSYVDHFYAMKEKAGIPKWERNFYKLLMNSLYGKFIEARNASSLLNVKYDIDKDEVQFSLELVSGGLFNPFIASLITGHTRAYLHSLELEFEAIHSSTDGIMSRCKKVAGLSNELGGISIESSGDVLLLRNKLYIVYTKDKEKAALDRSGKPIKSCIEPAQWIQKYALHGFFANVQTLEQMIKNGVEEYEYVKVNKLRESLRRGLKVNRFQKQQRKLNL